MPGEIDHIVLKVDLLGCKKGKPNMSADRNAELLGGIPLFHNLSPQQLSAIVNKCEKEFFDAGDVIIKNRRKSKAGYLILSGEIETRPSKSSSLKAETYESGAFIGEMAMLTETVATMDIVAKSKVRALMIKRDTLYEVLDDDPDIAHRLTEKVTERLIHLAHDLRELDARFAALEISAEDSLAALA